MIDLSTDGNLRMFANAHGNRALAQHLRQNKRYHKYDGYLNFTDQAEVMLIHTACLYFVADIRITLNRRVKYTQVESNLWRMVTNEDDVNEITILPITAEPTKKTQKNIPIIVNPVNDVIVKTSKPRQCCVVS